MRKIAVSILLVFALYACAVPDAVPGCERYTSSFSDVFDTHSDLIAYAKTQEEFDEYSEIVYDRMAELHKLFDIYSDYEGINNLKTINDNAGIKPIAVDRDIIELVQFGITAYEQTNGTVNIAMGSVLKLWHEARTASPANPDNAYLPDMEQLKAAALNTDINDIVIDEIAGTIFLKNPETSLDVGAIAKGWAAGEAMKAAQKAGLQSGLLNAGGDVVTLGIPMGRSSEGWRVGIENPKVSADGVREIVDMVLVSDMAVVTSGGYRRFYTVDGIVYNHIIDSETLMPAAHHASVTVLHHDAAVADMLSTALFILTKEQGELLLKEWDAEAIWIDK